MNNKLMTEQTYEGYQISIYSVKDLQKFKDIKARLLFNLFETSITSQIVENVCNIILFLVVRDWLSPIIASKIFCIWFLKIVV